MGGKPVVFAVLGEGRGCVVAVVGLHNDANHDCTVSVTLTKFALLLLIFITQCQDLTADVDELSSNASQRDSYHRQRLEIPRPTIAIRSYCCPPADCLHNRAGDCGTHIFPVHHFTSLRSAASSRQHKLERRPVSNPHPQQIWRHYQQCRYQHCCYRQCRYKQRVLSAPSV